MISQKNHIKILSDLKKDKVLTITKADKANTIVIMDSYDYDRKMNTIISIYTIIQWYIQLYTTAYEKLAFDHTDKYLKSIRKEQESLKNNLHIIQKFYDKILSMRLFRTQDLWST